MRCGLVLLVSCSSGSSIPTSDISAAIRAEARGLVSTSLNMSLRDRSSPSLPVELGDSDTLIVTSGGLSRTMDKVEPGVNFVTFQTMASGTMFEINFERVVDDGAPRSIVTLPVGFDLVGPATMSRASALTLTWSPAGSPDRMSWEAQGDCIESAEGFSADPDTGSLTIRADTLRSNGADQCTVTVTVSRTNTGVLDEHFRTGSVEGVQSRTVKITSTP